MPLFKLFHNAFIRTLVMKLKADVVMKGDIIFNFGQPVPGVYFGEPWEQRVPPGPPFPVAFPHGACTCLCDIRGFVMPSNVASVTCNR